MDIKLKIELLKNTEEVEKILEFELEPYVHFNYSMNSFGMLFKLSNHNIEYINNSQINLINNVIQGATSKETCFLKITIEAGTNIILKTESLKTVAYDINNDSGEIQEFLRFV